MMLALAIGDAYGAGFEYTANRLVREHNDLSGYFQHPRHRGIKPGMYTDDTQMSLAIAEQIISGDAWTPEVLATRFVDVFHRDPREGYAGRFYDFLQKTKSGKAFLRNIRPQSEKSGAAMRAVPIGLYADVETVKANCILQAKITHDTPGGIGAAVAAAVAAHYVFHKVGPLSGLIHFVVDHVEDIFYYDWYRSWNQKVGHLGSDSVHAALYLLTQYQSMSGLLKACIALTGDVDTVATIALGIAAHSAEYQQDLPKHLIDSLENGQFGRDYLIQLDAQLERLL